MESGVLSRQNLSAPGYCETHQASRSTCRAAPRQMLLGGRSTFLILCLFLCFVLKTFSTTSIVFCANCVNCHEIVSRNCISLQWYFILPYYFWIVHDLFTLLFGLLMAGAWCCIRFHRYVCHHDEVLSVFDFWQTQAYRSRWVEIKQRSSVFGNSVHSQPHIIFIASWNNIPEDDLICKMCAMFMFLNQMLARMGHAPSSSSPDVENRDVRRSSGVFHIIRNANTSNY